MLEQQLQAMCQKNMWNWLQLNLHPCLFDRYPRHQTDHLLYEQTCLRFELKGTRISQDSISFERIFPKTNPSSPRPCLGVKILQSSDPTSEDSAKSRANVSQGGGAQMVLDAQSSWSGPCRSDHTPYPSTEPAGTPLKAEKTGGSSMLGFLNRKARQRTAVRSPKSREYWGRQVRGKLLVAENELYHWQLLCTTKNKEIEIQTVYGNQFSIELVDVTNN